MKTKHAEQIIRVATIHNGQTQTEVLESYAKTGVMPLGLARWDGLILDPTTRKKYYDYWPAWTGTWLSYKKGQNYGYINNLGEKPTKILMPLKGGWYKANNKWKFPNGAPSDQSDPEARRLYKFDDRDWQGLLVRCGVFYGVVFYDVRVVYAGCGPGGRCGVLAVQTKKPKGGAQPPTGPIEARVGKDGTLKAPKAWAGKRVSIDLIEE